MEETDRKLHNITDNQPWWVVPVLFPIGLAVWLVPMYWMDTIGLLAGLVIIAILITLLFTSFIMANNSFRRRVFMESEEHTYDNNCQVCGILFGYNPAEHQYDDIPSDHDRMHICRRKSGQMDYMN